MSRFQKTPFTVHVHDIVHRPGEMRELDLTIVTPERMGEGLIAVPAGREMRVTVRLESLHDGILATGEVDTVADGQSARTLADMQERVQVDFAEMFAYGLDEAFDYQVQDEHVDLEPVIRDAVVLSLPFQPEVPGEDRDLDLGPGISLVLADSDPEPVIDQRWAALSGFRASEDSGAAREDADTETQRDES
ncbi:DUF177 domain-containing protein [Clavibacter michiganensis subsp. insidiosus]|uniref:DUF177 domain-containing protein n=1 Tax=Clavibacter michiganensis subsp. insidiosus TaxID=33014 RepID=A0A399SN04_9MICO|nr:DUF177 domain-containing protein [Clavibacter michiganensis]AWG01141.1 hypothetical protein BEH62_05970 [Clavibacter michiganensis subsp. insidiosus]OQJ60299.1 hypothetical protein B5P21_10525 [Clavibacter michiganensis subsp. insidiosus]RII88766.1 DUF177 domain-containing protein [Clavibacter michiganensis subsp. insidiosus]RIJ45030.1 DUF177 domain-containing protein [Clavibacter michiganensis subsp. insidiosus]RMC83705.1 DUF177 domain-containing protein [Clavibacter michiganensis subsp. i